MRYHKYQIKEPPAMTQTCKVCRKDIHMEVDVGGYPNEPPEQVNCPGDTTRAPILVWQEPVKNGREIWLNVQRCILWARETDGTILDFDGEVRLGGVLLMVRRERGWDVPAYLLDDDPEKAKRLVVRIFGTDLWVPRPSLIEEIRNF